MSYPLSDKYRTLNAPPILSHKCPIPIPIMFNFTVQSFHMVNIDVPASVGSPSHDTQTLLDKTVERAMTHSVYVHH